MPHGLPDVRGILLYKQDVVVLREPGLPHAQGGDRGSITEFSYQSRQRLAFVAANTPIRFRTMLTLTYPAEWETDGEKVKAHFRAFREWIARDIGSRPEYLWFLEFQERGAPHFHLLVDWPLSLDVDERKWFRWRVSVTWYRLVGSESIDHLIAGTRVERIRKVDGAARYGVKYALKMRQKAVPPGYQNVGRFWGCSRGVIPKPEQEVRCTEDDLRGVLEGWQYEPDEHTPLYTLLYGVADRVREYLGVAHDRENDHTCHTWYHDHTPDYNPG